MMILTLLPPEGSVAIREAARVRFAPGPGSSVVERTAAAVPAASLKKTDPSKSRRQGRRWPRWNVAVAGLVPNGENPAQ
jgi:hypothetical protein